MRTRLRSEDGMALTVAIMVLMVMILLAGASVSVATNGSALSGRDANDKRALETAQAGLRTALYRINMLAPGDANCVGLAVGTPDANGLCTDGSESTGTGATFQYWTTAKMSGTATCAGLALSNAVGLSQRCITATGTVNGTTDRVQARVVSYDSSPLFPYGGVIGLNSVNIANNAVINGAVASNGTITYSNNSSSTSATVGPNGKVSLSNGASDGTQTQLPAGQSITLNPVNPGNSASVNDDGRITNGLLGTPVSPYDAMGGSVTWNPATRVLSLGNKASWTMSGGTYNLCHLDAANNAVISVATGAKVQLFIDSPDDPNSGCSSTLGGDGVLNLGNNSLNNVGADPTALQIYVYGRNDKSNVVTIRNNGNFYGSLYAPQSTINLTNNGNAFGGIAGWNVNLVNNFTFGWDTRDANLTASSLGLAYQTAWKQCPSAPTTSDPTSNC